MQMASAYKILIRLLANGERNNGQIVIEMAINSYRFNWTQASIFQYIRVVIVTNEN